MERDDITIFSCIRHEPMQRVLVIRSSSKLFPMVVEELQKQFPHITIDALVPVSCTVPLDGITMIWRIPSDRFRWRTILWIYKTIPAYTYDAVIVLYNDIRGLRYLNIDMYACSVRAKMLLAVSINKNVRIVCFRYIIHKILQRCWSFIWVAINSVLTFFVIVILIMGMILTIPWYSISHK